MVSSGRVFEACLHLVKPFEAEELVLVLVFGQEAWPPVSRLLRDAVQLRVSSHLLISSDRGRGKRAFEMQAYQARTPGPKATCASREGGQAE